MKIECKGSRGGRLWEMSGVERGEQEDQHDP